MFYLRLSVHVRHRSSRVGVGACWQGGFPALLPEGSYSSESSDSLVFPQLADDSRILTPSPRYTLSSSNRQVESDSVAFPSSSCCSPINGLCLSPILQPSGGMIPAPITQSLFPDWSGTQATLFVWSSSEDVLLCTEDIHSCGGL